MSILDEVGKKHLTYGVVTGVLLFLGIVLGVKICGELVAIMLLAYAIYKIINPRKDPVDVVARDAVIMIIGVFLGFSVMLLGYILYSMVIPILR